MSTIPARIPEADWLSWPPEARQFILVQQQEIEQLRGQLTALASELASLRQQIGRSSRNSSKPPGFCEAVAASEAVSRVIPAQGLSCRRCGTLLEGEDSDPLRHQVIEITPITPVVIEHRLICPCCSSSTHASFRRMWT